MLTGVLSKDSPGLLLQLSLVLAPPKIVELSDVYAKLFEFGLVSEGDVKRAINASYNPRPARIMQIMVAEEKEASSDVLASSILACLEPAKLLAIQAQFPKFSPLAIASHNFPKDCDTSIEAQRIALALRLDLIRHLHMSTLDITAQITLYNSTVNEFLAKLSPDSNERVKLLLRTALNHVARRLGV